LEDEKGDQVKLKEQATVDVVIEADPEATTSADTKKKKPESSDETSIPPTPKRHRSSQETGAP
jgi:hypothetical protein